jgi:hypothetical protein
MNITVVESTTLARVAYDDLRQLLRLEFRSRAIYQYSDVPPAVHQALLQTSSKGSYFNRAIRGQFPYARVSNAQAGVPHQAGRDER